MGVVQKHPRFHYWSEEPLNGEPPLELLAEAFVTPTELFYVRCHGPVPAVDAGSYRLVVDGLVERPLELGLDELRERFATVETVAALHCAGNRRAELVAVEPIPGEIPWREGAIGNARWRGVRLADVLAAAGVRAEARHVELVGLEETAEGGPFGASIPIGKEALLAFEMNGAPLEPVHGFPLRAVVPGYIGARSVKWLARVTLRAEPSENRFQASSYRVDGVALAENAVNCVICRVGASEVVGWACAGGDRTVERVEMSADGGATWREADLIGDGAWRLWRATIELPPGEHELVARAWDSAGTTQPDSAAAVWNAKGYANNAWHRVRFTAR